MARSIEKEAKTVEEAIQAALEELGIEQEDADVEILESGSKGILGLGNKNATVRVTEHVSDVKKVAKFLDEFINVSKDDSVDPANQAKFEIHETVVDGEPTIAVDITGEDVAHIIGRHGDTLYALTYIANVIVNKDAEDYKRVSIDVGGYRKHREDILVSMANRAADKVVRFKHPITLDPMPAAERRIIHTALQSNSRVETESTGVEPNRSIVIKLKPYVKKF